MNRTVISERDVLRARTTLGPSTVETTPDQDQYSDRLLKYIPPEVIVAYAVLEGVATRSNEPHANIWAWIIFAVICGATPVYVIKIGGVRKLLQVVISTVAFVVWAFTYPTAPFKDMTSGVASTVVLVLYTFLIPLFTVP